MKPIKYFLLARFIKLILQFGFLITSLFFLMYLSSALFGTKRFFELNGWTIGSKFEGYQLNAQMDLSIPDTVTYNAHGKSHNYTNNAKDLPIKQQFVNKFISYEDRTVQIDNRLHVSGNTTVRILSAHKGQNLFWAIIEMINIAISGVVFLLLIKMANRYMDGDIFMPRTFKLVSFFGILLISSEIFEFVVGYINTKLVQSPELQTTSTLTNSYSNTVDIQFSFGNAFSLTNIGIGIFIILLSQVLKQAVTVKQENELTI